jgi:hypothetical protein
VGAAAEERQPNFFGESITVVDKDLSDIIVSVDPGNTLVGRIEPPQEAQITMTVEVEDMGFSTMMQSAGAFLVNARSNKKGEFTLKGVGNGSYTIIAKADSGDEGELPVEVSGDASDLVVTLEGRATARGIVLDSRGNPVEGAQVEFEARAQRSRPNFNINGAGKQTLTGPDGRFVHVGLADGTFDVTVSDGGQLAWAGAAEKERFDAKLVNIENRQNPPELRLVVETRDHSLKGLVLGPDSTPLPDAWVTATWLNAEDAEKPESDEDQDSERKQRRKWRWTPPEAPVLTDESGRFTISKLRDGHYELVAEGLRGGAKGSLDRAKVDTQVTIRIESLGTLMGKVSKGGGPLGDYVILADGPNRRRVHVVRDDGSYKLPRLEPGEYKLKVSSTEGSATATATVKTGEDTIMNLKLANFGSVSGTLIEATSGEPLVGIAAVASVGGDGSEWAENAMELMMGAGPRTDKEGNFRVGKLSAGEGQLFLFDPKSKGFQMIAMESFTLQPGENKDLGKINGVLPNRVAKEERGTLGIRTEVKSLADSVCEGEVDRSESIGDGEHLWITRLDEGGPAQQSGAEKCDRVTSVQGVDAQAGARTLEQLLEADVKIGTTVTVGVMRESGPTTLSITAAPEPGDPTE